MPNFVVLQGDFGWYAAVTFEGGYLYLHNDGLFRSSAATFPSGGEEYTGIFKSEADISPALQKCLEQWDRNKDIIAARLKGYCVQ